MEKKEMFQKDIRKSLLIAGFLLILFVILYYLEQNFNLLSSFFKF